MDRSRKKGWWKLAPRAREAGKHKGVGKGTKRNRKSPVEKYGAEQKQLLQPICSRYMYAYLQKDGKRGV